MTEGKKRISRRSLIKGAAIAGGAAVVGAGALAVPLTKDPQIDDDYPEVPENKVELPPNGKSVLIIGGGLAGLQAGVELSARGFKITILERAGIPGGKLKSWRDRHFGPADDPAKQDPAFPGYIREHGIHAVWGFYNNLREFLGRHGWRLANMPSDASVYNFLDKDGTESHLRNCTWPKPYDKLHLVLNARGVKHLPEADRMDFVKLAFKLFTFDYTDPKQRAYMDSMTFMEYGRRQGLTETLLTKICDSLLEMAYFDNVTSASAVTLANIFQLVSGSTDDMKISLYNNPVQESFIQPMVDFIRSRGGEIHYNTEVTRFEKKDGLISRVLAGEVSLHGQNRIRRCSVCGNLIFDGMEADGECPFCGAHVEMLHELSPGERAERAWSADYYISALDIPGLQRLVSTNIGTLGDIPYFKNILELHPKAVFVANLWFDGKGHWERRIKDADGRPALCFFATGFQHLGITVNRSLRVKFPDLPWDWSTEFPDRDVTIIETQIAKTDLVTGKSTAEIAQLCYEELKAVMPGLPPPRSAYVNRWYNYNGYGVGDEQRRPATQSPIDNLLFIGDLAFVPHPAVFMEKTNVTAKWATNLILEKAGIKEGHIKILASGTPIFTIDLLKHAVSVKV